VRFSESDSLRWETQAPEQARVGETVPITLSLRNVGTKPIELHLRGRTVAFDIVVTAPDGRVAWRRLEGASLPAILRLELLAPGQQLTFSDTWTQKSDRGQQVAPGIYTVHGEFPTDAPEPLRTPSVKVAIREK
jgi:hypothetical protein